MAATRIDLLSKKEDSCDNCAYFFVLASLPEEDRKFIEKEIGVDRKYMEVFGKCQRYPPQHIGNYKGTPFFRFPRVNGKANWCGEFKRRSGV